MLIRCLNFSRNRTLFKTLLKQDLNLVQTRNFKFDFWNQPFGYLIKPPPGKRGSKEQEAWFHQWAKINFFIGQFFFSVKKICDVFESLICYCFLFLQSASVRKRVKVSLAQISQIENDFLSFKKRFNMEKVVKTTLILIYHLYYILVQIIHFVYYQKVF